MESPLTGPGPSDGFFCCCFSEWTSLRWGEGWKRQIRLGFPGSSDGKASARNAGDWGLIPRSGRSPGEGSGNPLQDFCLENSMDGGAWWVHGVSKSRTRLLSDFTHFIRKTSMISIPQIIPHFLSQFPGFSRQLPCLKRLLKWTLGRRWRGWRQGDTENWLLFKGKYSQQDLVCTLLT